MTPTILFVEADGNQTSVTAEAGCTLMELALRNAIGGILAECGGACQCGTCHVYIDEAWIAKLPPPDLVEDAMLDNIAVDRAPNSRLACQVQIRAELNGLAVRLPSRQI